MSSHERPTAGDHVELAGVARDVATARGFAREFLVQHGVDVADGPGHAAITIVSELVTNAIVHGAGPLVLDIVLEPDAVQLAVEDSSFRPPSPRVEDLDAENGRGLRIVDALSEEWESASTAVGKRVTARVPLPRA